MIFAITLVIFVLLSAGLLVIGGFLVFKKSKYDTPVTATITGVICEKDTNKCNVTLTFKDSKKKEVKRTAVINGPVTVGSTRGIMYDSSNPNDIYLSQPRVKLIGGGLMAFGIIVLIGCAVAAYFRYRSPSPPPQQPQPYSTFDEQEEPSMFQDEKPRSRSRFEEKRSSPPSLESSTFEDEKSSPRSRYEYSSYPEETLQARKYADDMVQSVTERARRV